MEGNEAEWPGFIAGDRLGFPRVSAPRRENSRALCRCLRESALAGTGERWRRVRIGMAGSGGDGRDFPRAHADAGGMARAQPPCITSAPLEPGPRATPKKSARPKPGSDPSLASPHPGPTANTGIQTSPHCIWRAWMGQIQASKQTLGLSAYRAVMQRIGPQQQQDQVKQICGNALLAA